MNKKLNCWWNPYMTWKNLQDTVFSLNTGQEYRKWKWKVYFLCRDCVVENGRGHSGQGKKRSCGW